jgi:hypothetical protein
MHGGLAPAPALGCSGFLRLLLLLLLCSVELTPSHLPVFLCFACIGTPSHLLVAHLVFK